jgi:hypothetical protein
MASLVNLARGFLIVYNEASVGLVYLQNKAILLNELDLGFNSLANLVVLESKGVEF